MGYACPVCGDPQSDGEHLANHLAFTAMLGDADHEEWLDEHAPEWTDTDPAELAGRVTDHAEEREFPQVFEDTTGDGHDHEHDGQGHGHGHEHGHGHSHSGSHGIDSGVAPGGVADPAEMFDDADDDGDESAPSDVLAEARELTQERRTNDADDDADDDADETDGSLSDETDGDPDREEDR
jgi:hypothetical protein